MRRLVFAGLFVALAGLASPTGGQPEKQPDKKIDKKIEKIDKKTEKQPPKAASAYLEVRLPPNASLTFDGYQTRQRGPVRYFTTPPLVPGYKYYYELVATWPGKDGKPEKDSKTVNVNPGETARVQLGPPPPEKIDKPKDKEKPKDKVKDKDKSADKGFIKLFNGKDFTGWKQFVDPKKSVDPSEIWSIKDGMIICQGQVNGYLITEQEYGDYILKVQWRWGEKVHTKSGVRNSGVFVHVTGPDKIWPKSIEAQLMDKRAGDFWLVDNFKLAVDPKRQDPKVARHYFRMTDTDVENPIGQWNQYDITCKGNTIKLVINGKLVNEGEEAELSKGKILLQSEGAEIHFRNVELKPLTGKKAIKIKVQPIDKKRPIDDKATRILLIGKDRDHAFSTHEYMADCQILAKCLRQTPGVEAVVSNGWPKGPDMLKGVKAIVLHTRMGGDVLFNPLIRDQVEKLMKNGVGLTAIHWSTGADAKNGQVWLDTLGGWFNAEPKVGFSKYGVRTSKLKQVQPEHPICRGWKEYDLREEYYYLLKFRPDIKTILEAEIDKTMYPVAWIYERPDSNGGRSFGHVGGHFHDNFGIPEFRQAIVNGILWTAHIDVPSEGAPVQITKKDLELPPKEQPKPKVAPIVPPRKGETETIKLFNGTDLDGWEGYKDLWSVKDGVIVAKNTKPLKYSTYLLTKRNFTDFRLIFQAKLVESEMHSGVSLWGEVYPKADGKVTDPKTDRTEYTYKGHLVMFPSGWGMYDLFGRNGLPVSGAPAKKVGKQHDWNDIEILAQGNRVRVAVNGHAVVDWRDPEPNRIKEGPIGLQLHSNTIPQEVHFRGLVLETFPKEDRLLTVK